ncbi:MAG: methylmalonyl Co-A mutase-associated GTPase MeaB [Desulfomonilaceae bacterium]
MNRFTDQPMPWAGTTVPTGLSVRTCNDPEDNILTFSQDILKGNVRAAARLIRLLDDQDEQVRGELGELYRHSGRAHVVGFTGAPGVGKSTLVDGIIARFRKDGKTVGVLAVDPTSPFSGGAILGDRVRMQRHFLDEGVFIRSLATRGNFGGLSRSTMDAVVVLDALGKDVVILETVGVGQDEVDIAQSAHTTVLVTIPGMGDDIQAIKAGLMEIGDILVVNKADREGASRTVRELRFMQQMSMDCRSNEDWIAPIIETVAVSGQGLESLYQAILKHREYLLESGAQKLRAIEHTRIKNQLMDLIKETLAKMVVEEGGGAARLDEMVEKIVHRQTDPYAAARDLVNLFLRSVSRES